MFKRKIMSIFLSAVLTVSSLQLQGFTAKGATGITTLRFSDDSIGEEVSGSGYSISETTLTINASGIYKITGSCTNGNIVVSKGVEGVVLYLSNLTLSSTDTAPIVVKKTSGVTLHLDGENTLTDNEDPANETSTDTEIAEAFEGAAIKVKAGSTLEVCGDTGTLNIYGNAKNGLKGTTETAFTLNGGNINVKSALNNGIAFDGNMNFNAGSVNVVCDGDAIKAVPDATDTTSEGKVVIRGGSFHIESQGDGICADSLLNILNGDFDIKTMSGYKDSNFNSDTMSCKGLKASSADDESSTSTDSTEKDNTINITGGDFSINTPDDAIHSDAYIEVTGGTFDIDSGDDGIHADTRLDIGAANGYDRDPEININNSYEGLEAGNVYIYSGKSYVVADDDGINAGGGSSSGTDPGAGGGNNFRPGSSSATSNYNLYVMGGNVYVNCNGDGLDSNGSMYLYGGMSTVLSQAANGDNSPLDADGTIEVKGGSVFAAGSGQMAETVTGNGQTVTISGGSSGGMGRPGGSSSSNTYSAGSIITVKSGNDTVYNEKLLKNSNYILYSDPDVSNTVTFATSTSLDTCISNPWEHDFDNGVIDEAATETKTGIMKYSCNDCDRIEYKTIPMKGISYTCDGHEEVSESVTEYAASFDTDEHATVDIYYTQSTDKADETNVTAAVARNSVTGEKDVTGDGQINFKINIDEGYNMDDISITGTYKNLKIIDEENKIYRITKVTSDLVVTITTSLSESDISQSGTPTPTSSSGSEATASPTASPTSSDIPKTSDTPEVTASPTSSDIPEASDTPEVTASPTSSDIPKVSDTPEATASPTSSDIPKASDTPVAASDSGSNTSNTDILYGNDGSALSKGATYEAADSVITSLKSDKDPSGSEFGILSFREVKTAKKSITLRWNKPTGAKKYVIYANKCGNFKKYKKIKTTKNNTLKVKNIAGKKIKKGTFYKFIAVALDSSNKVISTSKVVHAVTVGGKYTNLKSLKTKSSANNKKTSVTIKSGEVYNFATKGIKKTNKLKIKNHRKITYETADKTIAGITKAGTVRAGKKGVTYVYAYAQNGIYKKLRVKVV